MTILLLVRTSCSGLDVLTWACLQSKDAMLQKSLLDNMLRGLNKYTHQIYKRKQAFLYIIRCTCSAGFAALYRMLMPLESRPGAKHSASSMNVHLRALAVSPPSLAIPTAGMPAASSSLTCSQQIIKATIINTVTI